MNLGDIDSICIYLGMMELILVMLSIEDNCVLSAGQST